MKITDERISEKVRNITFNGGNVTINGRPQPLNTNDVKFVRVTDNRTHLDPVCAYVEVTLTNGDILEGIWYPPNTLQGFQTEDLILGSKKEN